MGLATYATASTFRIVRKINSWSVKQRRRLKFAPIWLFLMLYVLHQSSAAQSGTSAVPDAHPGRPTVSTRLSPAAFEFFEYSACSRGLATTSPLLSTVAQFWRTAC
jgi:hypothetical protein